MNPISSAAAFIKQEFFQIVPPTIYFLVTFNIVVLTTAMVLKEFEVHISGHAAATMLALIVAKVVLVVDKIEYVRRFDGKPLVYPVFFKAFTYSLVVFLFRLLEQWIPGLFETGTIAGATSTSWTGSSGVSFSWRKFGFLFSSSSISHSQHSSRCSA
jgi:hypothetical protein